MYTKKKKNDLCNGIKFQCIAEIALCKVFDEIFYFLNLCLFIY